MTKNQRNRLPEAPGIYKFFDAAGRLLYVGKAKNLKKRVNSYFTKHHADLKTPILVSQIETIDVMLTQSEQEALILEDQIVKTYQPKYNIALKDDKSYPFIKIPINDPNPKFLVVRERNRDGALYFGPYPHLGSSRWVQRMLYDLFPIRDWLRPKVTDEENKELIQEAVLFLSGKDKQLIKTLKAQMKLYSGQKQFEKAAIIRDRIQKLAIMSQQQAVQFKDRGRTQVWAVAQNDVYLYGVVQTFVDGRLLNQNGVYLEKNMGISEADFLIQSLARHGDMSDKIICPPKFQKELSSLKLKITFAKKGVKAQLLAGAEKNAKWSLSRLETKPLYDPVSIQRRLSLSKPPIHIAGIDISHLQGTNIVGSAVFFSNGKPNKSQYRKFIIRGLSGKSNDPAAIYEVVSRRLKHEPLPDLLLIDGGRPQLNFAEKAMRKLGLLGKIDVIALAKREEEIYSIDSKQTLKLNRMDPILHIFQAVRDESHRFALTFQRKKRKLLAVFLAIFLTVGAAHAGVKSVDDAQDQLEEISSKLEKNKKQLEEKQAEKQIAEKNLWVLARDLKFLELKRNSAVRELNHIRNKSEDTKDRIKDLMDTYAKKEDVFKKRIVEIYKNKNLGFLEYLFSPNEVMSFLDATYFFKKVIEADAILISDLKGQYETLVTQKGQLEKQSQKIVALKSDIQDQEGKIQERKDSQQKLIETLRFQIAEIERKNRELEASSQQIAQFIVNAGRGKEGFFGTGSFVKPVLGWVSSRFGARIHPIFKRWIQHRGIDFAAPRGFRISAADSGTVIVAGQKPEYHGYGKITIIDHGRNPKTGKRISTVYAHQSRILVKEGDFVKKGEEIGWVGSTGYATGPHLHFEVRLDGVPVDPLKYLNIY